MARRNKKSWFDVLFDFVAANPRMSAAIAFELGALAAQAALNAKKSYRDVQRHGVAAASARVIDALPHVPGIENLKALVAQPQRRAKKSSARKAKTGRGKARGSRSRRAARGANANGASAAQG